MQRSTVIYNLNPRNQVSNSNREPQEMNQLEEYQNFLIEVLKVTAESKGARDVVYSLLERNLDKLDDLFMEILEDWGTENLGKVESEQADYNARVIFAFSNLLLEFPLGNRLNHWEIVITGYKLALQVYTPEDFPESWAGTQNNLGIAYSHRIKEDKALNLESALNCLPGSINSLDP